MDNQRRVRCPSCESSVRATETCRRCGQCTYCCSHFGCRVPVTAAGLQLAASMRRS